MYRVLAVAAGCCWTAGGAGDYGDAMMAWQLLALGGEQRAHRWTTLPLYYTVKFGIFLRWARRSTAARRCR